MSESGEDPWDWSVDQVINYLCYSREEWIDGKCDSRNIEFLGDQLREQGVSGWVLLTAVDTNVLKTDFGLKSLGDRAAIIYAIEMLRAQSSKYAARTSALAMSRDPAAPSSLDGFGSFTSAATTPLPTPTFIAPPSRRQLPTETPPQLAETAQNLTNLTLKRPAQEDSPTPSQSQLPASRPPPPKRKRLDVTKDLVTIPLKNKLPKSSLSNTTISNLSLSDFFSPSDDPNAPLSEAELEFSHSQFQSQDEPLPSPAVARAANRAMKAFLTKTEREVEQNGESSTLVVYPHSKRWLPDKTQERRRWVVQTTPGEDPTVKYEEPINDEWTYLEKWNKHDPDILSLENIPDGSIASESDAATQDSFIVEEASKEPSLDAKTVQYIVDNAILRFTENWKARKLPRLVRSERTSLRNVGLHRADRERALLRLKADLDRYETFLARQKGEILAEKKWNTVAEVESICGSMEQTVTNREETQWRICQINRDSDKPGATQAQRVKFGAARSKESVADADAPNEMSDFIVDDDPIDHAPSKSTPNDDVDKEISGQIDSDKIEDGGTTDDDLPSPSTVQAPLTSSPLISELRTPAPKREMESPPSTLGAIPLPANSSVTSIKNNWPSFLGPGIEVIDLFSDQSDTEESNTPAKKSASKKITINDTTYWDRLESADDPGKLLSAVVQHLLTNEDIEELHRLLVNRKLLWTTIKKTLVQIGRSPYQQIPHMSVMITRLFMLFCYYELRYYKSPLADCIVGARRILEGQFKKTPPQNATEFVSTLSQAIRARESSGVLSDNSESDVEEMPTSTKKKHVRHVATNLVAKRNREDALKRQAEQANVIENYTVVTGEGSEKIQINILKLDEDEKVFLDPSIACRAQAHQVSGIRFMWREVIVASGRMGEPQGCLLAHTMGLGKTMQAISFLATASQAASSSNKRIAEQIPNQLRKRQSLVICPSGLVDNWVNEFDKWAPRPVEKSVGMVQRITSDMNKVMRNETLKNWNKLGGVLIIGFGLIIQMVDESKMEDYPQAREIIFEGPSIVIADEAHNVKNPDSKLSKIARSFKTNARIALTGSPLANNLREYFELVNWISPGYLGSLQEFRHRFQKPIEEGLYLESTGMQRRMALKWLAVLKKEIEPKVNRADISVLKGKLPPKIEFQIRVPLLEFQKECYEMYVDNILSNRNVDNVSNTSLWAFINALSMLCNHPFVFWRNIFENKKNEMEDDEDPLDEFMNSSTRKEQFKNKVEELFTKVDKTEANLSARTFLFLEIVKLSIESGEQILAFTHSLGMLLCLEKLLTAKGIKYFRLDGSTKHSERAEMIKSFNQNSVSVFLISSRAGGYGFNLPAASRVVVFDSGFNPQHEEQAIARAYRIGQKKNVFVYRFITGGTFQEQLNNQSVFKTQLALRVNDTKNIRSLAMKPSDYIYMPRESEAEHVDEYLGKDTIILDKILTNPEVVERVLVRGITSMETLRAEAEDDLTVEELREVEMIYSMQNALLPQGTSQSSESGAGLQVSTTAPLAPPISFSAAQLNHLQSAMTTAGPASSPFAFERPIFGSVPGMPSTSYGVPLHPGYSFPPQPPAETGALQSPFLQAGLPLQLGVSTAPSLAPLRINDGEPILISSPSSSDPPSPSRAGAGEGESAAGPGAGEQMSRRPSGPSEPSWRVPSGPSSRVPSEGPASTLVPVSASAFAPVSAISSAGAAGNQPNQSIQPTNPYPASHARHVVYSGPGAALMMGEPRTPGREAVRSSTLKGPSPIQWGRPSDRYRPGQASASASSVSTSQQSGTSSSIAQSQAPTPVPAPVPIPKPAPLRPTSPISSDKPLDQGPPQWMREQLDKGVPNPNLAPVQPRAHGQAGEGGAGVVQGVGLGVGPGAGPGMDLRPSYSAASGPPGLPGLPGVPGLPTRYGPRPGPGPGPGPGLGPGADGMPFGMASMGPGPAPGPRRYTPRGGGGYPGRGAGRFGGSFRR